MKEGLDMLADFYAEVDLICVIVLCCLAYHTIHSNFSTTDKTNFLMVLIANIIFAFSDLIWIFNNGYIDGSGMTFSGRVCCYIINIVNICFSAIVGLTWLNFSNNLQERYFINTVKGRVLSLIPIAVLAILAVTTEKTHFLFYITENGEYVREAGYALQVVISYGYIVVAVVCSLIAARKAANQQAKKRCMVMASFAVFPTIACFAQLCADGMSILFIGIVVALLNVYISLQEQQVLIDPLTGLNNRTLLDQKIADSVQSLDGGHDLWLLIMDADKFKEINDTHGHLEGDRALNLIADTLKKVCSSSGDFICRYGGDEFVVLHKTRKNQDCTEFSAKINNRLAEYSLPYNLSLSIGAAKYTGDISDWMQFMKRADEELYRVKKNMR